MWKGPKTETTSDRNQKITKASRKTSHTHTRTHTLPRALHNKQNKQGVGLWHLVTYLYFERRQYVSGLKYEIT